MDLAVGADPALVVEAGRLGPPGGAVKARALARGSEGFVE